MKKIWMKNGWMAFLDGCQMNDKWMNKMYGKLLNENYGWMNDKWKP
jgi:hypothetical protein